MSAVFPSSLPPAGTTWVDAWTGGSVTTSGGDLLLFMECTYYRLTAGSASALRIVVDSTNYPSSTGMKQYTNELASHKMFARTVLITGLSLGSHTVKVQIQSVDASGTANTDVNDFLRMTALELKR